MKERRPHLAFERLDGFGQCGLGDIAFGRRLREVESLGRRQDVPDLGHFHGWNLPKFSAPYSSLAVLTITVGY